MALTKEQSLRQYGTEAYTGWGEVEAAADAAAKGLSAGSGASVLSTLDAQVDKYVDNLISEARGDREFIVKKLDAEHRLALGTDDVARARFMEKVADSLETKIGRIPYDFEKYTARELEDFARGQERIVQNKDIALQRLAEDERIARAEFEETVAAEQEQQGASLTERGLLQGTREEATGKAGQLVGKLQESIKERQDALARAVGRSTEDTTLGATRGLEDITRGKERGLEDITTAARREAIGAQTSKDLGTEAADRSLSQRMKALEEQRKLAKLDNPVFASYGL